MQEVIEAITTTAAALESAGRPGISTVHEAREALDGWWVDFTWRDQPDVEPLMTPPDMPVGHLYGGEWDYDLYLPRRVFFARIWHGEGYFATVTSETVGNSLYTRPRWLKRDIQTFTEDLFPAWITYWVRHPVTPTWLRTPITDHADPAVFVPYVNALAQHVIAVFHALMPSQK